MAVSKSLFMAGLLVIFLVTSQADSCTDKRSGKKYPNYLVSVPLIIPHDDGSSDTYYYTGILVRDYWVLFAHPDISLFNRGFIMALDYITMNYHPNFGQGCGIDKYIRHPDFKKGSRHTDMMLLKLTKNCTDKRPQNIKPVEINEDSNCPAANQNITVIGWNSEEDRTSDYRMYIADLKVLDSSRSLEQSKTTDKDVEGADRCPTDKKTTIFAGMRAGGYVGKCNGLLGGVLMATCGNSANVPVGLLTCGYDCAHQERVFTRLSEYKKWIDDTIEHYDGTNN